VAVGEFIGDNTRHFANQWWVWQALHKDGASTIQLEKLPMIQRVRHGRRARRRADW
jgi:hypothetical protein